MDLTPPHSRYIQHFSTPLSQLPSTRKRRLEESLDVDGSLSSPKFSSTFNESLISNFKECHLVEASPEKQMKLSASSSVIAASPIHESHKILYKSLKVVKPERKYGYRLRSIRRESGSHFERILHTNEVMDIVFKNLSDGDLFRFSRVSQGCYTALQQSKKALARFEAFKLLYRDNKENYVITPPGSPEKCDSPPRTSSDNLNKFIRVAKQIKAPQSLTKCRKCNGVAIVENNISQCQNIYSCGVIYCMLCSSTSETGPDNFKDMCGYASLRPRLANVSNTLEDSLFNFSSQDSGFYSENDSSAPRVKRNLFLSSNKSTSENSRTLTASNKIKTVVTQRKRDSITFTEVIRNKEIARNVECESPPRYLYAIGSKQSKRNLKRLTR